MPALHNFIRRFPSYARHDNHFPRRPRSVYHICVGRDNSASIIATLPVLKEMDFGLDYTLPETGDDDHICYICDLRKRRTDNSHSLPRRTAMDSIRGITAHCVVTAARLTPTWSLL